MDAAVVRERTGSGPTRGGRPATGAPAPTGTAGARPLPVLVPRAPGIPGWVPRWCHDAGHDLHVTAAPLDEAAARAAREGCALLVPRATAPPPARRAVVVAIDDLPADAPVLVTAADVAAWLGGDLVAVHAVPLSFGERSVGLDEALRHGHDVLDRAVVGLQPATRAEVRLERRWPHEIAGRCGPAGLLVVGGSGHDPARLFGPVALSALAHAPCPVLVVPRPVACRAR